MSGGRGREGEGGRVEGKFIRKERIEEGERRRLTIINGCRKSSAASTKRFVWTKDSQVERELRGRRISGGRRREGEGERKRKCGGEKERIEEGEA